MNLNATLIGQIAFALSILCAVAGYVLGKRKTNHPKLMTVLGFIFGFIPPLGPIFILVLALKKDVYSASEIQP
jgi:predicted PurR-regulated permease PerM